MGFEFRFESVRAHRKRLEEIAQRDYLSARQELDQCLGLIDSHYQSIEDAREQILKLQRGQRTSDLFHICQNESFIEGQKIRIRLEKERARELMRVVEEKQSKLVEAARDRKMMDKLRDRMQKQYKKTVRKLETKRVDDLVIMRANRRRVL